MYGVGNSSSGTRRSFGIDNKMIGVECLKRFVICCTSSTATTKKEADAATRGTSEAIRQRGGSRRRGGGCRCAVVVVVAAGCWSGVAAFGTVGASSGADAAGRQTVGAGAHCGSAAAATARLREEAVRGLRSTADDTAAVACRVERCVRACDIAALLPIFFNADR